MQQKRFQEGVMRNTAKGGMQEKCMVSKEERGREEDWREEEGT